MARAEGALINVSVDTRVLERKLAVLRTDEIPTAKRNALNDLARDVVKEERKEIARVFDRPTKFVQNAPRIRKKASKTDPVAEMWLGGAVDYVLKRHIPRFNPSRHHKGAEHVLMQAGLLRRGQWLVPSRTTKLDRHGNVPRARMEAMLRDAIGGGRGSYMWGTVKSKSGGDVTGIWRRAAFLARRHNALEMVVVDKDPIYPKRFRYQQVAIDHGRRRAPHHATQAVIHSIRRRYGV